ncbi:RsmB/NOP family class I SAM-dependent RNA methyltransferase [Protaetiibacter larvae]|uniref:rRNA small subunit methyltransferase B n=1 Tax=Protaetiibacter larvae TaxID=2592654 RepID=A0A5C1Y811_9MICO|nr:transcription antitermination factor NusB [Protaetiibacter larvae]QEO10114.1 rRNA small subunit methyltransferase B [Protaetiibacter larvae]
MSRVQPARQLAVEVLAAVRESDAYANLLLPARIREARLDGADAGFATELVYGTLRMQGYYDAVIADAARRPVSRIDPPVLDILRLGAHQLLSMRVPAYAVSDESVELVRRARVSSAAGFVNGVLRTIARRSGEGWRERVLADRHGSDRLAVEYSHPVWIVDAVRAALALEGAADELAELLAADNASPQLAFAALPGLQDPDVLIADPDSPFSTGVVSPIALRSAGGDPARIPEVAAGRVRVQDEGSQLAALALSRARPVRAGERWLDLCAGPGGKAAVLAAEAALGGARLLANELVPARAGLVRNAFAVFGEAAPEVVVGDGRRFGAAGERFDRILLDAPCTGLGALRRRPEARWRKSPSDLSELVALQAQLLDAAVGALAPGGLLAYVTCSPHPAETREQVDAALARHHALRTVDTAAVVTGIARAPLGLPPAPSAQLWPHRHGTDAMFIQLLTRVEA